MGVFNPAPNHQTILTILEDGKNQIYESNSPAVVPELGEIIFIATPGSGFERYRVKDRNLVFDASTERRIEHVLIAVEKMK